MRDRTILDAIGHTPLVRLARMAPLYRLFAKLEGVNPGGSVKDRPALQMVLDAEAAGLLPPGGTLIEATSGNTGIGLAVVAAARGYHLVLTMPENMNAERVRLLEWLGAEVILTPTREGMSGAVWRAEEEARARGGFLTRQFENPSNPAAHARTTAQEIWADTEGEIDILVLGIGTGGTLTGIGEALKAKKPGLRLVGVEPERSAVLSGSRPGLTRIHGLGAGFAPGVLKRELMDAIVKVADEEAIRMARTVARSEGILAGISSGAALWAAMREAEAAGPKTTVVTLFPDSAERYLTMLEVEKG